MDTDVLASKWIFNYFQVFGIHSPNPRKLNYIIYQAVLLIGFLANYVIALCIEFSGNGVDTTTVFVDVIDCKF